MLEPSYSLTPRQLEFIRLQLRNAMHGIRYVTGNMPTYADSDLNRRLAGVEAHVMAVQHLLNTDGGEEITE